MKQKSKAIRIMLATLFIVIISQGTVFATGNDSSSPSSSLSGVQIAGAFILLLLALLVPLVKKSRREVSNK